MSSTSITVQEAMGLDNCRHVLGISGGKDSGALAIYIRDNYPDIHEKIEYFFTDTGAELQEVYDFLDQLEAYLGKEIKRLSSERDFEHWLKIHNDYLPSPRQRWCTRMMKIKPFENFVGDDKVVSYIGIRADENREGYVSQKDTIHAVFPFIEDGLVRNDIFKILEDSVGIPEYYEWRSRSGCYFCFFQRQDEWLGLSTRHPELFEKAKKIEQTSGQGYTWVQGKSLDDVYETALNRLVKEEPEVFEKLKRVEKGDGKSGSLEKGKELDDSILKALHKRKVKEAKKGSSIKGVPVTWQERLKHEDDDDPEDQSCIICSL